MEIRLARSNGRTPNGRTPNGRTPSSRTPNRASLGRRAAAAAAVCALVVGAAACGSAKEAGDGGDKKSSKGSGATKGGGTNKPFSIGLLLPETKTARYEKFDRPYIEAELKRLCAACKVLYENANQEANLQQQQIDTLLTKGVKVLILDSVDYKAVAGSVAKAKQQGVKVVAYDRLARGPIDAYTSFDNRTVGKMQGQALLDAMKKKGDPKAGQVVMINGSPTDPNAGDFKKGAHSALDGKVKIGKEYDIIDWSADKANESMAGAISALGKDKVKGVYVANDPMAGGAIAALKSGGVTPLPPVTGQDAEITGVQRILIGEQSMTIYKPIKPEAEAAAKMAIALGRGQELTDARIGVSGGTVKKVDNGTAENIPSVILDPVVVTKDNIGDTVVKNGFWKPGEICKGRFAPSCAKAGLS